VAVGGLVYSRQNFSLLMKPNLGNPLAHLMEIKTFKSAAFGLCECASKLYPEMQVVLVMVCDEVTATIPLFAAFEALV